MRACAIAIGAALAGQPGHAERITDFAPFTHDTTRPEVLVLEGEIGARTGFVFKRAMRRFSGITTLELATAGGSVYDALPLAYDIRAAGLVTAIPAGRACASACSFLFFAGVERRAEGRLGVHQIRFPGADPATFQNVLGDVFALLEDFDVPPGVHARMMGTPADAMFWFEPDRMEALGLLGAVAAPAGGAQGGAQGAEPGAEPGAAQEATPGPSAGAVTEVLQPQTAAPGGSAAADTLPPVVTPGTTAPGADQAEAGQAEAGKAEAGQAEVGQAPDSQPDPAQPSEAEAGVSANAAPQSVPQTAAAQPATTPTTTPPPADPAQVVVTVKADGGGDHSEIGAAIAAAPEGARVEVYPGQYQGSVHVQRPVDIVGVGPRDQILWEARDNSVVIWQAASGRVAGLTLRQTLSDPDKFVAALMVWAGAPQIEACDLSATSGPAIAASGADSRPVISNNLLHNSKDAGAVYFDQAGGVLDNNHITGNDGPGVEIIGAAPLVRGNRIHAVRGAGISLYEPGGGTIEGNDIYDLVRPGIDVNMRANPLVRGNKIHDIDDSGITISLDGAGTYEDNEIYGNAFPQVMIGEGTPVLRGNTIRDGKIGGILIYGAGDVVIAGNRIFAHPGSGVTVAETGRAVVEGNTISGNRDGVAVEDAGSAEIIGNDLRQNRAGALRLESTGTVVERDNVTE